MNQPDSKTIADLRQELFSAIQGLKSGSVSLDQARAINELSKTIVDTAKVEVDYLRVTDGGAAPFLEGPKAQPELPPGVTGITQHRIGR